MLNILLADAEKFDTLNSHAALEIGRLLRRLDDLHERTAHVRTRARVSRLIAQHGTVAATHAAVQSAVETAQSELERLGSDNASLLLAEAALRASVKPHAQKILGVISAREYDVKHLRAAMDAARKRRDKAISTLIEAGMPASIAPSCAKPTKADLDALTAEIAAAEERAAEARASMGSMLKQVRAVAARTPAPLPEAA